MSSVAENFCRCGVRLFYNGSLHWNRLLPFLKRLIMAIMPRKYRMRQQTTDWRHSFGIGNVSGFEKFWDEQKKEWMLTFIIHLSYYSDAIFCLFMSFKSGWAVYCAVCVNTTNTKNIDRTSKVIELVTLYERKFRCITMDLDPYLKNWSLPRKVSSDFLRKFPVAYIILSWRQITQQEFSEIPLNMKLSHLYCGCMRPYILLYRAIPT